MAAVASIRDSAPAMATWNTYVWVDSADETASRVRDAGGRVVIEPFDFMDASRIAVFTDPEGAAFCAWQAKQHQGARVVNDPGSLNFNGLNTRDFLERHDPGLRERMAQIDAPEGFADASSVSRPWRRPGSLRLGGSS